ncbi:MAG: hypothetical protein LBK95_02220 [Bifidobacteriaceae bacterium]|nr:hypothetical protein [Bifidobacteriaceae bacterium]
MVAVKVLAAAPTPAAGSAHLPPMTETDPLAPLEARIADAINTGDIPLADRLRRQWVRAHLLEKVTRRA